MYIYFKLLVKIATVWTLHNEQQDWKYFAINIMIINISTFCVWLNDFSIIIWITMIRTKKCILSNLNKLLLRDGAWIMLHFYNRYGGAMV